MVHLAPKFSGFGYPGFAPTKSGRLFLPYRIRCGYDVRGLNIAVLRFTHHFAESYPPEVIGYVS
jgi:hypothetical protein